MTGVPRVTFVDNGDDWEAIYIDGVVWRQDHRMRARDWIDLLVHLGAATGETRHVTIDDDMGDFPDRLVDIR